MKLSDVTGPTDTAPSSGKLKLSDLTGGAVKPAKQPADDISMAPGAPGQKGVTPEEAAARDSSGGGATVKEEFSTPLGLSADQKAELDKSKPAIDAVMPGAAEMYAGGAKVLDAAGRAVDLGMKGVASAAGAVGGDKLKRDVYGLEQLIPFVQPELASLRMPKSAGPAGAPSATQTSAETLARRIGGPDAHKTEAVQRVIKRMQQDVKGGGPTAQDMLDITSATPDKPLTIADVGGENVVGLLGRVARSPGPAKNIVAKFLDERDVKAGSRIAGSIAGAMGSDSAYETAEALGQARKAASKPLYDEALKPGSVAPLEGQFERSFQESSDAKAQATKDLATAQTKLTQATARKSQAGDNVYGANAALRAEKEAQSDVLDARMKLQQANALHDENTSQLRKAQDAQANGERGGVYSPHIARMIRNPIVQQGIKAGWRIERNLADAENRPIDATDYALHEGPDGNLTLVRTPNMRLIQMAKEGLDAKIEEARDPLTGRINWTKELRSVDELRRSFVGEVDRINPSYRDAREAWAGPSQSMDAITWGQEVISSKARPEVIRDRFERMSKSEQEFARLGVGDYLLSQIAKSGVHADEAKRIIGNDFTRQRLAPFFQSDAELTRFVDGLKAETRMFDTRYKTLRNSLTAARGAEDQSPETLAATSAGKGVLKLLHGGMTSGLAHLYQAFDELSKRNDPDINAFIARILTTPLGEGGGEAGELLRSAGDLPPPRTLPRLPSGAPVARAAEGSKPYLLPLGSGDSERRAQDVSALGM